ncbi:Uncharacterised protein [Mycobacteroides abscessus subsp. bolletii]|nr:Uncharacterised protein [Mycobacteroides abscessus subsp. bolletii]
MFRSTAPKIIPAVVAFALLFSGCGVLSLPPASTETNAEGTPVTSASPTSSSPPSSTAATEPTGNTSHHEDSVYTPATNKAPAQNPPQPKIYDESTELTARGLSYATMDWMVSHNYAVTTGDSTVARAAIDSKTLPAFIEMYDTYDEVYRQDSWIVGGIMYLEPAPKSFAETEQPGVYSMNVRYGRECGSWTIDRTETYECTEGSRDIPATIFARFTGERWVIEDLLFAPA